MLCAPLDWQYAELPLSASMQSCVLCSFVRCGTSNQIEKNKQKKNNLSFAIKLVYLHFLNELFTRGASVEAVEFLQTRFQVFCLYHLHLTN